MLRWLTHSRFFSLILFLWILTIPSNLFLKFGEHQAYVHGLLSDYLLVKLYLSDFLSLTLIGLCWWPLRQKLSLTKIQMLSTGVVFLLIFRQFWTDHPAAAIWQLVRLTGIGLLVLGLLNRQILKYRSVLLFSSWASLMLQTGLATYQFFFQKSLAGYYFFGEPDLQRGFGLSQGIFDGVEKVLPYGTTAHPNVLAGTATVFTWIIGLIYLRTTQRTPWHHVAVITALGANLSIMYMTQSWAAGLSLVLGMSLLTANSVKQFTQLYLYLLTVGGVWLLLVLPVILAASTGFNQFDQSLTRRVYLNQAAIAIWESNPLLGIGLNQFTSQVETFSPNPEVVRFVQPVHHVGLLFVSETGLLGLSLLMIGLWRWRGRNQVILATFFLLPILATDHYLMTLATGQLLSVLAIWSSSLLNIDERLS